MSSVDPMATARSQAAPQPEIGPRLVFREGQLAGRIIRAQLFERQKAEVGRKYATKDRRPIDPPPVVQLRLFQATTDSECEQEFDDYDDIHCSGFICQAALFEVPKSSPLEVCPSSWVPPTVDLTHELAGSTFVQGIKFQEGSKSVVLFVFSDLSVRAEGNFILRYRCFDVLSLAEPSGTVIQRNHRPMLCECYGAPFIIYTNRNFPGLSPSTDLTKRLAEQGVRTNNRIKERTRGPNTAGTKRKNRGDADDELTDDNDE